MTRGTLPGLTLLLTILAAGAGCAAVKSSYAYDVGGFQAGTPVKSENCKDAAVVLPHDLKRTTEIGKRALELVNGSIEKESEGYLQARRASQMGLFVGSGGETLRIEMKPVDPSKTFATVTTEYHFAGGAGMKPWSCEVIDQMVRLSAKP